MTEALGRPCGANDPTREAAQRLFYQGMRERLRVLRLHLGLSKREVAERLGISVRAYRYRERSAKRMAVPFIVRLAETFDVSIDWLSGAQWPVAQWPTASAPVTPAGKAIPPGLRLVSERRPPSAGDLSEAEVLSLYRALPDAADFRRIGRLVAAAGGGVHAMAWGTLLFSRAAGLPCKAARQDVVVADRRPAAS